MKKSTLQGKREKKYTWKEIKKTIDEVYDTYHHYDDWGIRVIYQESMVQQMKRKLSAPKVAPKTGKRK